MRKLGAGLSIAAIALVGAAPAFGGANPRASCLGVVSSGLGGEPGARADMAHLILSISPEATGEPPGAFHKILAQRHPGGEFDC